MNTLRTMLASLSLSCLAILPVLAQPAFDAAALQALAAQRFGNPIQAARPSPYPGLIELESDGQLFYTDPQARFFFVGHLIDSQTRVDLTEQRMAQLARAGVSALPEALAIRQVRGKGERTLYLFEDPYCPYCRTLHQTLGQLDNVTLYTFVSAQLAPDSATKARAIWCAPDRAQAWHAWMTQHRAPPKAAPDCQAPTEAIHALGQRLQINGTPTLLFADGSRLTGVPSTDELERRLQASATAPAPAPAPPQ